jgi:hypothetical protein
LGGCVVSGDCGDEEMDNRGSGSMSRAALERKGRSIRRLVRRLGCSLLS